MISRIIAYFNKDLVKRNEALLSELKGQQKAAFDWKMLHSNLETELKVLKMERTELLNKINAPKSVQIVKADQQDPAPTDDGARAAYMANFARLHTDYLGPKLLHMIANVREELDWNGMPNDEHRYGLVGMTRTEYDAYLRGTSNAFKLLLEYGDQCVSEDEDYKRRTKIS